MKTTSRLFATFALILISSSSAPAQGLPVNTVEFDAPSVGRAMKFNLILPEGYDKDSDKRYPVLYMLHGLTSNYIAWSRLGVPREAQHHDMIVVMPDVGNSWYVNWSTSEDDQENAWEDFVIKDLVGYVDSHYRTVAAREGRGIIGLS